MTKNICLKKISLAIHPDLSTGSMIMQQITKNFVSDLQTEMYGENAFYTPDPLGFKAAVGLVKEIRIFDVQSSLDPSFEIQDLLPESERILFMSGIDRLDTEEDVLKLEKNLRGIAEIYDTLSRDAQFVFKSIQTLVHFSTFAKLAVPFVDMDTGLEKSSDKPSEKSSEQEANASGAENEIEAQIQETATSSAELVSSGARHLFERSEISSYGTFSEKVKFFLYNTRENGNGSFKGLVQRTYVDKYFELIFESFESGDFTIEQFILAARRQKDKLAVYVDTPQYRSVNGIYRRFFDPENPYSFFSIAMNTDHRISKQARAHMDVLAAIISAQKSVIQQNFIKSTNYGFSTTKTNGVKEFKNTLKDSIVGKLFEEKKEGNTIRYGLSRYAKEKFFSNGAYALFNDPEGLHININGKKTVLKREHLIYNSGYGYMSEKFMNNAINLFSNSTDLYVMLTDLGINISKEFFYHKINEDPGTKKDGKRSLANLAIESYLILAMQYSEEGNSLSLDKESMHMVSTVAGRRNEDIAKIVNSGLRRDELSETKDEDEKPWSNFVYTPSSLWESFEGFAAHSALARYEKGNPLVYIMDGSKEVVDKYPNTMHRVLANLSDTKVKISEFLRSLENPITGILAPTVDEYLKKTFPAVYSEIYKNPVVSGDLEIGEPLYYKGTKNGKTNRSREFLKMTEGEFMSEVLKMMVGKGFGYSYHHMHDLQADRGFAVFSMLGNENNTKHRYFPVLVNGKFKPVKYDGTSGDLALEKIRRIPFHHAGKIMEEVYGILGDDAMAEKINRLVETGSLAEIKKEFMNLEKRINKEFQIDPFLINRLTAKKHFVLSNGKLEVSPLLKGQMEISWPQFEKSIEEEYLNFAEYLFSVFSDPHFPSEGRFNLSWEQIRSRELFKDKRFRGQGTFKGNPTVRLYLHEKINSEEYKSMSVEDKIQLYHPALYSLFLTYFVNQTHISQRLTGGLHLYGFDKATGGRMSHSYITDNVKRIGTFTTPKIEPVYRETLEDGRIFNREGLDREITVGYISDMEFHSTLDNERFHEVFVAANQEEVSALEKNGKKVNFKQETTDGSIFSSTITMRKLRASYGGENGFSVNTLIKANLHSFDSKTGDLHLPKGLIQVITPEVLENAEGHYLGMLQMMYRTATIVFGENRETLWDHMKGQINIGKSIHDADRYVSDLYFMARNNENGFSMEGDIVDMLSANSSNKGARKGLNTLNDLGNPEMEETVYSRVPTDGFGIILDLQKDIDKENLEMTLSSQMLFLLGINGENHHKSTAMYEIVKSMSQKEMDAISEEIANAFGGVDKKKIIENKAAVKKWMIREIKNSFVAKSDFGLIYKLVEDTNNASISNPIIFEEIFSKVGSRISKAIVPKMNGFKAVQIPAHNFVKLYEDPDSKRWIMKKDIIRKGIDPASVRSRNIRYSEPAGKQLSDTDVFSGNIFAGKYGMDEELTLDQVFSIKVNGQEVNLEASDFEKIQYGNKFVVLQEALNNGEKIDWLSSPIVSNMLERGEFTGETAAKIMSGTLNRIEESLVLNMLKERSKTMNRMLYGLMTRIPGTGKNSSSPTRIRGFVNGYKNVVFTPAEWFIISGSDNNGDTVQFWLYDKSGKETNNAGLDVSRKILKDPANMMEIFSGINLDFFNDRAASGKKKLVETGKGFFHGSLRTLSALRTNNATGAALTGIHATQAKVHSYTAIAKSMIDFLINANEEMRSNEKLQRLARKKFGAFSENGTEFNSGMLFKNDQGVYVDEKGQFIYKWNEKLTNGAIDNAKHLSINFSNLNTYNAGLQQAMTFFGTSKENIVRVLSDPTVMRIYKKVEVLDNIANPFRGNAKKAIEKLDDENMHTQVFGNLDNATKSTFEQYFAKKNWQIDFANPTDVYGFVMYMESVAEEINNIRKVIKVTESVPGRSAKQELMIEGLLDAVNMGFGWDNKFVDAVSLLRFIKSLENREAFDHVSKTKTAIVVNPLHNKRVVEALEKSSVVHPLVMIATIPHIREFAKRHLEFHLMKEGHILSDPNVKAIKEELSNYIEFVQMRNERNRTQINKSIYRFINSVFLEQFNAYVFNGETFNLATISGKAAFRKQFSDRISVLKMDTENAFLKRVETDGDRVYFPGSEKMDALSRIVPEEHFARLDEKTKEAFFLYEMTGSDTHLQYKKDSFVAFMDAKTFEGYHGFLRNMEATKGLFRNNDDAMAFLKAFAFENPSMISRVYARSVSGNINYGYLSDTDESVKGKKKFGMKAEEVRDFEFGVFNAERIAAAKKFEDEISVLLGETEALRAEFEAIVEKDILDKADKKRLNKIKELLGEKADNMNILQARTKATLSEPVSEEGIAKFKVIKGFDKKSGQVTKRLMEATKEKDGPVSLEQVYYPFDTKINYHSRSGEIPTVKEEKRMVDSIAVLGNMVSEGKALDGKYYSYKDSKMYQIKDGNIEI